MAACSCPAPKIKIASVQKKSSEIEGDRQLHATMSLQPYFPATLMRNDPSAKGSRYAVWQAWHCWPSVAIAGLT
jgi:hypothetical protein